MAESRAEHLQWCKNRAIMEYDYYPTQAEKQRNGLTSMMSDMSKHPETQSDVVNHLCVMQMMVPMDRAAFVKFINGFN